jgi:hypothetical protein
MTLLGFGDLLERRGNVPEAEAALKRSLEIRIKAFGESNDMAQRTIKLLAGLYTEWKKPEQSAVHGVKSFTGTPPPSRTRSGTWTCSRIAPPTGQRVHVP